MTRNQAIERVRKLAEVTVERGATPAEEDNATAAAKRLIDRYDLSYHDVAYDEPGSDGLTEEQRWQQAFAATGFAAGMSVRFTVNGQPASADQFRTSAGFGRRRPTRERLPGDRR